MYDIQNIMCDIFTLMGDETTYFVDSLFIKGKYI